MTRAVLSIENISKAYRLGQIGTGTFSNDLKIWSARIRGKPNPMLKIGQEDQRHRNGEILWALKDVSFQVEQGEVLGIVGRNGAGKSSLLKILSRVTAPTSGLVKVNGRIASLLEVGTGFHPELTGRENIYLNGAILGMTKEEVKRKFDEIVAFAEIDKFIDTPVKRYSSGMYVRLAFAVAAHLESEILLVDEVLAVGDAEFQRKCIGKMGDVASKQGRTVLFVSHNMAAIENLCSNSILFNNGSIVQQGVTKSVIERYLVSALPITAQNESLLKHKDRTGTKKVLLSDFYVEDKFGNRLDTIRSGMDVNFVFCLQKNIQQMLNKIDIGFSLQTNMDAPLIVSYSSYTGQVFNLSESSGTYRCRMNDVPLAPGRYRVGARILVNGEEADWPRGCIRYLDVEPGDFFHTGRLGFSGNAPFLIRGEWVESHQEKV